MRWGQPVGCGKHLIEKLTPALYQVVEWICEKPLYMMGAGDTRRGDWLLLTESFAEDWLTADAAVECYKPILLQPSTEYSAWDAVVTAGSFGVITVPKRGQFDRHIERPGGIVVCGMSPRQPGGLRLLAHTSNRHVPDDIPKMMEILRLLNLLHVWRRGWANLQANEDLEASDAEG